MKREGNVIFFPNGGGTVRVKRAKRIKILKELCQSKDLVFRLRKTMDHFFPGLYESLREIEDYRQDPDYKIAAIIIAAIALFLFKCGSRNDLNNERKKEQFRKNYSRVFKVNLPHMDTVERVLRHLDEEVFEKLKVEMIQILITKKIPKKECFLEKYYQVAFDGCHVFNVKKDHCSSCLTSTSKKGKIRHFHVVVEAKLVTSNGFCFPLATEWVENPEGDFDKQDCEKNAFGRLADKLKKAFPQLPICVLADGLYPNEPFFNICQEKGWEWIVTFKNGNLPSVWKQVFQSKKAQEENTLYSLEFKNKKAFKCRYTWINNLCYKQHSIHWFECIEIPKNQTSKDKAARFVYLSSFEVTPDAILEMTKTGRLRWKIENEGFNTQKNHGYHMSHQYSRSSFDAFKNYYQCMQIAHIINQLYEKGSLLKPLLTAKMSLVKLWDIMMGEMRGGELDFKFFNDLLELRIQISFR